MINFELPFIVMQHMHCSPASRPPTQPPANDDDGGNYTQQQKQTTFPTDTIIYSKHSAHSALVATFSRPIETYIQWDKRFVISNENATENTV
jgi:hypothetical protein